MLNAFDTAEFDLEDCLADALEATLLDEAKAELRRDRENLHVFKAQPNAFTFSEPDAEYLAWAEWRAVHAASA